MSVKVLLLGATGYFGGTVLTFLRASYPELHIHALIRNPAHTSLVKAAGASEVTVNDADDHVLVRRLISESDIVIESANGFDVDIANNLLEGLRARKILTGRVGTLIHVSGTTAFVDGRTDGKWDPSLKFGTDNEEEVRQLTLDDLHGPFDVPLFRASDSGDFNLLTLCPPMIYGDGTGPVARSSLAFRMFLQSCGMGKKPFYVGEGSCQWAVVHIRDLLNVFRILFEQALQADSTLLPGGPYSRYFVASTGQISLKDFATLFARELFQRGIAESTEPVSLPYSDIADDFFARLMASNMVVAGKKALENGWKPLRSAVDEEQFTQHIGTALAELGIC